MSAQNTTIPRSPDWPGPDDAMMIGGMNRDDRGSCVRPPRGVGGDQTGDAAEQTRDEQPLEQEARHRADLVAEAGDRVGGDQDAPDEQDDVRRELDREKGGDQAT
jgi:hypothetical protein